MTEKLTTRDLIGTLIDLYSEQEYLEMTEGDTTEVVKAITEMNALISKKVDNIDYFMVELSRRSGLIDGEIDALNKEVKRLRSKKKAIQRTNDYFNKILLPMIVDTCGNDGVFETDTTRYKAYLTYGPIEITDEDLIDDDYKRYKIEVDKKKARAKAKDLADQGMGLSGFSIQKVKRIKRS